MSNKQYSLRKRLLVVNISITLVLLLILESIFYIYYYHSQKNILQNEVDDLANSIVSQVDYSIADIDNIAILLSTNSYIVSVMNSIDDGTYVSKLYGENSGADQEMNSLINSYNVRTNMVSRICIYSRDGYFVNSSGIEKRGFSWSDERLQSLANKFKKGNYVVYEVNQKDLIDESSDYGYISIIRPIRQYPTVSSKPIGYVEVQLSFKAIKNTLQNLNLKDLGIEISSPGDKSQLLVLSDENQKNNNFVIMKEETTYKQLLNIKLIKDSTDFYKTIINMLIISAIIFLTITICVYLTQRQAIRKITNPLIELFDQTKSIGLEKATENFDLSNKMNEVEGLKESFESMIVALQISSKQLMIAQTGKLKAQLLAMQSQIDPHFIYNTLTVISAYAVDEDYEKIQYVVQNLSKMIRYSTNFETPYCTIKEEIEHLRSYLNLITIRYTDNFEYTINCSGDINKCKVPHFIAQPLAENAITHSLKYKDYPWKINVECEVNKYHWRIIVEDNGIGITQEKANEVMLKTYQAIEKGTDYLIEQLKIGGLSLLNIVARLYLRYNQDMVFCISPAKNGGTKVIIGGNTSDIKL